MASWTDACTPTRYPGIWKTPKGYRIRVRAVDPRAGTLKERNQEFEGLTLEQAVVKQAEMRDEIRQRGRSVERRRERYADYATSLFERKVALGDLKSAKSRERWADTQDLHLIPAFGDWFVDAIQKKDIEEWKATQGRRVAQGKYSPNTVNGWLAILLTTPTRKARGGDRCGERARPTQSRKVEGGELVGITQAKQAKSGDPGGDRGDSSNESGAEVGNKTA